VNLAFYKKHNILKNCHILVKIVAIFDITSLFPNKMCKKVFGIWGSKNPQTMWRVSAEKPNLVGFFGFWGFK